MKVRRDTSKYKATPEETKLTWFATYYLLAVALFFALV